MPYTMNDLVKALQAQKIEKVATAFNAFVRTRIREVGLSRRILPPVTLQNTMLERDPHTQDYYWGIEVEPDIPTEGAYVMSLKGDPQKIQIKGNFVPAYLYQITTPTVEIHEQETWKKDYSIQDWLEKNFIRELEKAETRQILSLVHAAVADTGRVIDASGTGFTYEIILQQGIGLFSKNERSGPIGVIILNEYDYDEMVANLLSSGVAVDGFAKDIISNGMWGVTTIYGYNFIVTRQSSVVSPGVAYILAKPEWVGGFGILGDPQFYIESKKRTFTFEVWEDVATAVVNGYGVAMIFDSTKFRTGITAPAQNPDGTWNLNDVGNWSAYNEQGLA